MSIKPLAIGAVVFGTYALIGGAVQAYAAEPARVGPCSPDKASYVSVDPITGKETFVYVVSEKLMNTADGHPVRVFGVKRCQSKKDPITEQTLWLLEKKVTSVSEAEIANIVGSLAKGGAN